MTQATEVSEPRPSTRFSAATKAGLLLLPLIVLFLFAEFTGRMLERFAGYQPRRAAGFLTGNPYLRTALVPGMRFASGPFRVSVNALGFRGPDILVPKPAKTFRIFAVGESSTFGWKGIHSHEEAWPALLEGKLRAAYPGRRIEVINAGAPGYTSVEQRINFMLRISHLQPDAILIYHGNNDLNWSWVPSIETNLVYGRGPSVGPPSRFDRLIDQSYVFMELRSRMDIFTRSNATKYDLADTTAIRVLRDNLIGLVHDARRVGVRAAIGTFAHGLDESGKPGVFSADERALGVPAIGRWFEHLSPQGARLSFPEYNAMIRRLAIAEGLPLAEPALKVPGTPEYFTDWCHFTAKGEERMAELWFATVQGTGWLGTPTADRGSPVLR